MAEPNRPSQGHGQASDFYIACRTGDIAAVNRYLKTMHLREVSQVEESNRSTALHAAAFFGHKEVVERLLAIGADSHIRNGHGYTAEQEAKTPEIKALFAKYKTSN